jgi:hypothetical protein
MATSLSVSTTHRQRKSIGHRMQDDDMNCALETIILQISG